MVSQTYESMLCLKALPSDRHQAHVFVHIIGRIHEKRLDLFVYADRESVDCDINRKLCAFGIVSICKLTIDS